jgi:hypothetical protein
MQIVFDRIDATTPIGRVEDSSSSGTLVAHGCASGGGDVIAAMRGIIADHRISLPPKLNGLRSALATINTPRPANRSGGNRLAQSTPPVPGIDAGTAIHSEPAFARQTFCSLMFISDCGGERSKG